MLVGSETEILFDIGHLRKKVFNTLSNFELKNTLVQFHEKCFSVLSRIFSNALRS